MGAQPDLVNYRGEKMTDAERDYLFGGPFKVGGLSGDPTRQQEVLSNWLYGPPVKPVDPTEGFKSAMDTLGARQSAAVGEGFGGLFGGGIARGVPYSVPPLPKIGGK